MEVRELICAETAAPLLTYPACVCPITRAISHCDMPNCRLRRSRLVIGSAGGSSAGQNTNQMPITKQMALAASLASKCLTKADHHLV